MVSDSSLATLLVLSAILALVVIVAVAILPAHPWDALVFIR